MILAKSYEFKTSDDAWKEISLKMPLTSTCQVSIARSAQIELRTGTFGGNFLGPMKAFDAKIYNNGNFAFV